MNCAAVTKLNRSHPSLISCGFSTTSLSDEATPSTSIGHLLDRRYLNTLALMSTPALIGEHPLPQQDRTCSHKPDIAIWIRPSHINYHRVFADNGSQLFARDRARHRPVTSIEYRCHNWNGRGYHTNPR